jgi:very-short-patch-repair endonuclease
VKPNRAEERMADLLIGAGVLFERQRKWAGHRIDFTLLGPVPPVLVDVNGEWWHAWAKIVDCDRVKLNRVFGAGLLVLGVWSQRLEHDLAGVWDAISLAERGRLAFWDWNVPIGSLDEGVARIVRSRLAEGVHG